MILKRIYLKNFRQFYGEQSIDIAPPGSKNVTLIHAENGVGKTTLLNAMLWTLFNETTRKFEQKDNIVSLAALAEGDTSARVEIEFEDHGATFAAVRERRETPGGYKKMNFEVIPILENGIRGAAHPSPDKLIHSIIPRDIAQYFFFDGEQAETFSAETNYRQVSAAIRDILGCGLLETADGDFEYLAKNFDKELGELKGEKEIQQIESRISEYEGRVEQVQRKIAEADLNIDALEKELISIEASLRKAQASAEIQGKRDRKNEELRACDTEIRKVQSDLCQWIAQKGIAVVSSRLISTLQEFVSSETMHGRIPSPYNEQFVQGLLQEHRCICGRALGPGTPEWQAVSALLKDAANAESLDRLVKARARVSSLGELLKDAPSALLELQTRQAELRARHREIEQVIEDLGAKLEKEGGEDVAAREHARKQTALRIERLKLEKQTDITNRERDKEEIEKLRREVERLAAENKQAMRLVRRRNLAVEASRKLRSILAHYENEARAAIQNEVNRILERVARKHYRLEIGDHFELSLMLGDHVRAAKSTGENQLMSLAFIAALVSYSAKRLQQQGSALFIPATVAPLILDSPFGLLDTAYRRETAKFVPEMAPQVVLLVSSSQGKDEVIDALHSRVGMEYVLIAENSGSRGGKHEEYITVNGRRIETTLYGCLRNMTRIEKVS